MNRLADETSPYLRQHADNPVDWYPWGDEAFARARAEDKPILLSIGYSACHWCHVMAHESFENAEIAAVMNDRFVNVKVDREERPDVDAIYMQAVQTLSGHGGWPMTMFLAPDGRPFFGGTYFPSADRQGMPGFPRVLDAVDEAWRERRNDLLEQADSLTDAISRGNAIGIGPEATGTTAPIDAGVLDTAVASTRARFDPRFGGFGGAPKFPQAMTLTFLLSTLARRPDDETRGTVTVSLDAMAAGGMYDQVGGGFHRYSVDAYWLVPHFEKMLYDQALLLRAYLHGSLVTGEPRYRRIVEEIVTYVLRNLRHPDGGFFSAEDADSEGVEGKFYCWSIDELRAVCGDDADAVIRYFGVTDDGNFEDPHTGFRGNILHVVHRDEDRPPAVTRALPRLLATRDARVRPGLDDKVLLGWNALFLDALAEAAFVLDRGDWMDAARANAAFLVRALRRDDGRLLRSWQGGRAQILAYAEDHAALLDAVITLAEVDDIAWLDEARVVADDLVRLFADDEHGGFFSTGVDAEALIVRPKDFEDNATPSENSLAAHALLRLAALTGDDAYRERAERWVSMIAPVIGEHPTAFAYLLRAVDRIVHPSIEIAIVGDADDDARAALVDELRGRLLPSAVKAIAPAGVGDARTPLLTARGLVDGRATAYVCEHFVCGLPVHEASELRAQLSRD
ncbi:MAG TPA: thioredoxin domain-containing protein [Acidimicrobiia bacterium]|nr:thioredoxin domain-containing protein [Acidimicrobiia bacterium]